MVFALFQVLSCVRPSRQFSDSVAIAQASFVAQLVKNPPGMRETKVRSLGWEDLLNKIPLQHSGLENSMNRGAWRATVRGVTKNWTKLSY